MARQPDIDRILYFFLTCIVITVINCEPSASQIHKFCRVIDVKGICRVTEPMLMSIPLSKIVGACEHACVRAYVCL